MARSRGKSVLEQQRAACALRRQCQSAAGARRGQAPRHVAGPRLCRPLQRWRSERRADGERSRTRRFHPAADLPAGERQPDGAAGDGGRVPSRQRRAHHRCRAVHGVLAAGSPHARLAHVDRGEARREHAVERGRYAPAHDRSALGADSGFLRHSGGQRLRVARASRRCVASAAPEHDRRVAWTSAASRVPARSRSASTMRISPSSTSAVRARTSRR